MDTRTILLDRTFSYAAGLPFNQSASRRGRFCDRAATEIPSQCSWTIQRVVYNRGRPASATWMLRISQEYNVLLHTPNIDKFAKRGTLFNRAYCQFPLCNPSRTSILTGLRPDTTRVNSNSAVFRENLPNVVTLPQHFKTYGYHTQSVGKIAHKSIMQDDTYSWSVPSWTRGTYYDRPSIPVWQSLDVEDNKLRDGKIAKRAIKVLKEIENTQFFLAVGFQKPHLPFHVPKKYYELYEGEDFSLPPSSRLPSGTPVFTITTSEGLREYRDVPNRGTLSDAKTLELIRAYAASVSYMDAQVGRVLDRLDALRLTEKTVIVFAGDHGFHLGDHGTWLKNTLFEVSLRSPLIISVPGQTHQDVKTNALTELVDIYPTLCHACHLPIPSQLEGLSLLPVIEQPTRPWKTATFSQLNRSGKDISSIRTERYRYTEWGSHGRGGRELYDYDADPNETTNVSDLPENAELVSHLSEQLHAGWQAVLPDRHQQTPATQTLPWDINGDGIIDSQDLVLVSEKFGTKASKNSKTDVNKDGWVDITDLLTVASHFGESINPAGPPIHIKIPPQHLGLVEEWLTEARLADDGSDIFRQGIVALEGMLNNATPEKTKLLPNYPNPFNPETWIPYDLAEDTAVHIHIYNLKGESIRQLSLGFQTAGTYRTPSRAAYWDGRNTSGETAASGVYFYTLQAGDVNTIRQMVILK